MPAPDVPVVECHCHLLDRVRFGYQPGVFYDPVSAEQSDADYLAALFDAHGVAHAVVVGPNSGYNTDNRCLLDVLDRGVVATTMQMSLLGVDAFRSAGPLLDSLAGLGTMVDVQVEYDQLVDVAPI